MLTKNLKTGMERKHHLQLRLSSLFLPLAFLLMVKFGKLFLIRQYRVFLYSIFSLPSAAARNTTNRDKRRMLGRPDQGLGLNGLIGRGQPHAR